MCFLMLRVHQLMLFLIQGTNSNKGKHYAVSAKRMAFIAFIFL